MISSPYARRHISAEATSKSWNLVFTKASGERVEIVCCSTFVECDRMRAHLATLGCPSEIEAPSAALTGTAVRRQSATVS